MRYLWRALLGRRLDLLTSPVTPAGSNLGSSNFSLPGDLWVSQETLWVGTQEKLRDSESESSVPLWDVDVIISTSIWQCRYPHTPWVQTLSMSSSPGQPLPHWTIGSWDLKGPLEIALLLEISDLSTFHSLLFLLSLFLSFLPSFLPSRQLLLRLWIPKLVYLGIDSILHWLAVCALGQMT